MVLLRRWPLPVLAAAVAVCGLVMASGAEPLPLAVLVGVACYLVASRVPRRVSIAAVAAAAAALGAALGYADLTELAATVRASGTPVELRMPDTDRRLSPALELTVYRVVQEALTNVVKHAPGARATVDVAVLGKDVRIEVTDDGHPAGRADGPGVMPGHGIVGMRERIGAFGGSLAAGPCPADGFRVLAEVPAQGAP